MKRFLRAALAAVALSAAAVPVQAQTATRVGVLACDVSAGIGLIIGSQRSVSCVFAPIDGVRETYVGRITRFGLDLGITGGGELVWTVFAPTAVYAPGQLAGTYAGAGAEASLAVGLGANVLVGGSASTVALQPVSVQGQTGINLAVGVTGIEIARTVAR